MMWMNLHTIQGPLSLWLSLNQETKSAKDIHYIRICLGEWMAPWFLSEQRPDSWKPDRSQGSGVADSQPFMPLSWGKGIISLRHLPPAMSGILALLSLFHALQLTENPGTQLKHIGGYFAFHIRDWWEVPGVGVALLSFASAWSPLPKSHSLKWLLTVQPSHPCPRQKGGGRQTLSL